MSGHSKWANIKHRKESSDRRKGLLFNKLSKELMVAARLGGEDTGANSRLRIAIEKARAANMPRDSIERAIKKGAGISDGTSYEEISYEIFAPGGAALIVESLTDNKNRTTPEIKQILNKHNANLAGPNTVNHLFSRYGIIRIGHKDAEEEDLMEIALANGADDIQSYDPRQSKGDSDDDVGRDSDGDGGDSDAVSEGYFEIVCAVNAYPAVLEALKSRQIPIEDSGIRLTANRETIVPVTDIGQAQKLLRLMEALEQHADVETVHANIELAADVASALQE